jgi:hypothetical protein
VADLPALLGDRVSPDVAGGGPPMTPIPVLLVGAVLLGAAPSQKPPPKSSFRAEYDDPKKPELAEIAAKMKERQVLERAVEALSIVKLPRPITLKTASCGESRPGTPPTRT